MSEAPLSRLDATDVFEAFEASLVEGTPTLSLQNGRIWINGEDAFDAQRLVEALYAVEIERVRAVSRSQPGCDGERAASAGSEPSAPEPPWPRGAATNSKRVGWTAYFTGCDREGCPFPPERRDLHDGYREGWDAAQRKDTGASE